MKILFITPGNPHMKTPETTIAEQLSIRGHDITLAFGFSPDLLDNKYDIVVGAMEYSMNIANYIGAKLDIPVYNHMEWIPPWRVGMEDPKEWGYDGEQEEPLTQKHVQHFTELYIQQIQDWEKATVRSCAGDSLIGTMEPFMTKGNFFHIRFPTKRFGEMEKYRDDTIEEKYQIMATARLVPHKKIVHIIRALSLIKNAPVLKLIGYGPEIKQIGKEAARLKVHVDFLGPGQEGTKEKTIQESMFSVNIWAGLPIAESFYFGKPAITYNDAAVVEQFGEFPVYAERNNIRDLANRIEELCLNPQLRDDLGQCAQRALICNKMNIKMPDAACEEIEKILEEGLRIWTEEKLS